MANVMTDWKAGKKNYKIHVCYFVLLGPLLLVYLSSYFKQKSNQGRPGARHLCLSLPEEGVMDAIGVAMMLLGLRAASCCIWTAATVATGER